MNHFLIQTVLFTLSKIFKTKDLYQKNSEGDIRKFFDIYHTCETNLLGIFYPCTLGTR